MSSIFPFIEGNVFLELPESTAGAGDGLTVDLEQCDFIAEDSNTIGYSRYKVDLPQIEYTIAGGSAISYSFFESKHEFELELQLRPDKWIIIQSMLEEQQKRIRERTSTEVFVKLLDRRIADVYRLPRTRARDGGSISLTGLAIPAGSEVSFSWFSILFDYSQRYFDFLFRDGATNVDGLLSVSLTGKEGDLIPITEDTTLF